MAIEGVFYVHILVSDLARSKAFYGETLGWKLNTDEAMVAGFWFGSAYLVAQRDTRPDAERAYNAGMHISVKVSDIEAEHAGLKARGVEVSPIHDRPWGERNFSFADPDGYLWEYGQA